MAMGGGGGRGQVNSEINVTPMADVMLVLLIIFMVVTPMLQASTSVNLAETSNPDEKPDADKEDAMLIAITQDGNFYLGTEKIEIAEIGTKVAELAKERKKRILYVKSDSRARYGNVVDIVEAVRTAGIDQIALITDKVNPGTPKAAPAPQ